MGKFGVEGSLDNWFFLLSYWDKNYQGKFPTKPPFFLLTTMGGGKSLKYTYKTQQKY